MNYILLTAALLLQGLTYSYAQLTTPPEGGNKRAFVGERIALTDVTIEYHRPGVKGRDGKIWGQLIHTGFADLGFGTSKAAPWRAGANENTVIRFSTDVKVEGKELPAGKYGLFIAYDPNESTVIFSKNHTSWGSYFYDDKEDVLRVKVKPEATNNHVEWLKYEFTDQTDHGATVSLLWEKMRIPIRIETDYIKLQLESMRRELRGEKSFNPGWQSYVQAANFCLNNNTNLEEGLRWADHAINGLFVGDKNFVTLSTKAQILNKLGRTTEAHALMKEALPLGTMEQLHSYARQLVMQQKSKEAFEVFKLNHDKHPNQFMTLVGMARGYSAIGDYKKATSFAQKALPVATDKNNKDSVEAMVKKLQEGKDIN